MVPHPRPLWPVLLKLVDTHGLDINRASACGDTALHTAVRFGYAPRVEQLLAAGAAIDVVDAAGYTPLAIAAQEVLPVTVGMLMKHGADPNICTQEGETALSIAGGALCVRAVEELLVGEARIDSGGGGGGDAAAVHTVYSLLSRIVKKAGSGWTRTASAHSTRSCAC